MVLSLSPAFAENQMGYRLLSAQDASRLPHHQGALGLDVERARQLTDGGLTFEIIRVKGVRPGAAGAEAGLRPGDQIIALDGRVFPSLVAFSAYIGSTMPGSEMTVDYMPAGGGVEQAQRVTLRVGRAGAPVN
jgi:S1-C subfamily serine protease